MKWVGCKLQVDGNEKQIESFASRVNKNIYNDNLVLTFESIIPTPEIFIQLEQSTEWAKRNERIKLRQKAFESYGYKSIEEYRMKAWGVPFDVNCPERILKNDNRLIYEFETIGRPPILWVKKASLIFHNLKFTLVWEDNNDFLINEIKKGKVINEERKPIQIIF